MVGIPASLSYAVGCTPSVFSDMNFSLVGRLASEISLGFAQPVKGHINYSGDDLFNPFKLNFILRPSDAFTALSLNCTA